MTGCARWKCALPIAMTVLALGTIAVRAQAVGASGPTGAKDTNRLLPPRALLRIGTDELRIRSFSIARIVFSPDGRVIAVAEAYAAVPRVNLFDVRTGRLVKLITPPDRPTGWAQCVAFSPDNTKLAWGENGGQVALWDLSHDRLMYRDTFHGRGVSDVTFSPDGQIVASGGEDGTLHLRRAGDQPEDVVLDVATGARNPVRRGDTGNVARPDVPLYLAFTPDGARLVVGSGSSAAISVWSIKDCRLLRQIENAHGASGDTDRALSFVAVTPDGRRILSAGHSTARKTQPGPLVPAREITSTEIRLWNLDSGERIKDLHGREDFGRGYAALSRDGRRIAVGDCGMLRILDAATGRPERTISLPGCQGDRPVFSPDGTLVAMAIDNTVGIFDVGTGRRLHHDERAPGGYLGPAAWSPAGDRIVTGHSDGEIRVWDFATGKLIWHKLLAPLISVHGRNAGVTFVSFSRDGHQIVAAGGQDDALGYRKGFIASYDAAIGALELKAQQRDIRCAALAPDGRMIVVGTSDDVRGMTHLGDTRLAGVEVVTGRTRWANPPDDDGNPFLQVAGMRFQRDSSFLEVAISDGSVIRFNGLTGREQRRFLADGRTPEELKGKRKTNRDVLFYVAAFSDDGRTMVSYGREWICVWDVENGGLRRRIRCPYPPGCLLTLSSDGKTVATVEPLFPGKLSEDKICLYDTESGDLVLTLEPGDDRAHVLAFSPDDTKLLTGFHRGTAIIWDVRRGQAAARASN